MKSISDTCSDPWKFCKKDDTFLMNGKSHSIIFITLSILYRYGSQRLKITVLLFFLLQPKIVSESVLLTFLLSPFPSSFVHLLLKFILFLTYVNTTSSLISFCIFAVKEVLFYFESIKLPAILEVECKELLFSPTEPFQIQWLASIQYYLMFSCDCTWVTHLWYQHTILICLITDDIHFDNLR